MSSPRSAVFSGSRSSHGLSKARSLMDNSLYGGGCSTESDAGVNMKCGTEVGSVEVVDVDRGDDSLSNTSAKEPDPGEEIRDGVEEGDDGDDDEDSIDTLAGLVYKKLSVSSTNSSRDSSGSPSARRLCS